MTRSSRASGAGAAVAVGTFLALLCLGSALSWFFADIGDLRESVEAMEVDQQTLDDSNLSRAEFDDLVISIARWGVGGLQLLVAAQFAMFARLLSRRRSTGRIGLFVLGILGVLGSFLLGQLNPLAVVVGLAASVGLVVLTSLGSTRAEVAAAEAERTAARDPQHAHSPQTWGQPPSPGQTWSGPGYPGAAPGADTPGHGPAGMHGRPGVPGGADASGVTPAVWSPQSGHLPDQPPWAPVRAAVDPAPAPARSAPSGTGVPEPEGEPPTHDAKWDPVRGAYTRWEPARAVWVRHDTTTGEWFEID